MKGVEIITLRRKDMRDAFLMMMMMMMMVMMMMMMIVVKKKKKVVVIVARVRFISRYCCYHYACSVLNLLFQIGVYVCCLRVCVSVRACVRTRVHAYVCLNVTNFKCV